MTTIVNVCEAAMVTALQEQIYPSAVKVYPSDANEIKLEMPYVIVHAEEASEQIGPGTGIFKVPVEAIFRSHVKADSPEFRDSILVDFNNFVYSNPAQKLSNSVNFYVYGFVPVSAQMQVNTELKAYEYIQRWDIFCIPSAWPEGPNAPA